MLMQRITHCLKPLRIVRILFVTFTVTSPFGTSLSQLTPAQSPELKICILTLFFHLLQYLSIGVFIEVSQLKFCMHSRRFFCGQYIRRVRIYPTLDGQSSV